MKTYSPLPLLTAFALLSAAPAARGTQADNFGLGGHTTGRVAAVTAEPDTPFGAWYNPALLGARNEGTFGVATLVANSHYAPLGRVRVDGPRFRTQSGVVRDEAVALGDNRNVLWSLGYADASRLEALGRRLGWGLVASGPLGHLQSFASRSPYDFTSLRYGTADVQFQSSVGAAFEAIPDTLFVGLGLNFYISAAGRADMTLVGSNPTGRMALDVALNSSVVGGVYWNLFRNRLALVYRQAVAPALRQEFTGNVQLGGEEVLAQPVLVESSLYYQPESLEWEWQRQWTPQSMTSLGLAFHRWSHYQPAFLLAQAPDAHGNTVRTRRPALDVRDTLSPRFSLTYAPAPRWSVAAGYRYRPTPLRSLDGEANLLDTDTHIGGVSVDWQVAEAISVGVYGQYHWFVPREVRKADLEFVGAPGFSVRGSAHAYGLNLRARL